MPSIILNGGDPLKDCPTDFGSADQWAALANEGKNKLDSPLWSWDCGFKLDYDGPVLRFSSRFYPPKTHYGDRWDGTLTVLVMGREIMTKQFDCETLQELQLQVEAFTEEYAAALMAKMSA